MPRLPRAVATTTALLLLAGCGSAAPEADTTSAATTEPAVASEPVESPAEETTPDEDTTTPTDGLTRLQLGDTFTTDNGSEITAHEIQTDIPYDYESDDGGAWYAVDVSYCLSDTLPDPAVFEQFTHGWVMRTSEGWVLDYPSSSWDDIVSPSLDLYGVSPAAGECYRGWVLMDGPAEASVTSVRFYEVDWAV